MSLTFAQPPASICILRLSALGDVSHLLPVIHTLQDHWPSTKICWIIGRIEAELVRGLPGVEFIIYDKRSGQQGLKALQTQLAGRRFDLLLHMQAALRASRIARLIKAPIKLGFDRQRARDFQWLFTTHRIEARPNQHVLDGFFGFLEALGIKERKLDWQLLIPDIARTFAQQQLPQNQPLLMINPCTSNRSRNFRNWSAERYAEVAEYAINRYSMTVVLTGGPHPIEIDMAEAIQAATNQPLLNLVGKTDIKQLIAVLDQASVVIAPDTGPAHLANALGKPVIGLYVTSNPNRTGPYNSLQWTVNRYPDALRRYLGKSESEVRWGQRVRDPEAMLLIETEDVISRLDALLS